MSSHEKKVARGEREELCSQHRNKHQGTNRFSHQHSER